MTAIDELARRVREKIPIVSVTETRVPRRPFIIEFSGTPKSGKSYVSQRLESILGNNGFNVKYIQEAAAMNPLSRKEDMTFNVWNALTTLARIIEQADLHRAHVVIFDRGLFDIFVWMEWRRATGRLSDEENERITNFFLMRQWCQMIDLVFLLTVKPEISRRRDTEGLTERSGRVMNLETLSQINSAVEIAYERYRHHFRSVYRTDTSTLDPSEGTEKIVTMALNLFQDFAEEKVVVIDRKTIADLISRKQFMRADESGFETLIDVIRTNARVEVRRLAEINANLIKVVCGAVLFSHDKVLFLRRREQDPHDSFHNRYVIWAGGHARDNDIENKDVFESCVKRELAEELSIKSRYSLLPLGCLPGDSSGPGANHMLILFRAELESEDVSISMTEREFKDKTGMSVSGRFLYPKEIVEYWDELEPWTRTIIKDYFQIKPSSQETLFETNQI